MNLYKFQVRYLMYYSYTKHRIARDRLQEKLLASCRVGQIKIGKILR